VIPSACWSENGPIALIEIDNPPVNAASLAVRKALIDAVARAASSEGIAALVIASAGRTFCAGADIREFGLPVARPFLSDVIHAIENSPKPVVAAIHGAALGGGLEIAMACHYRVADPSAQLGLPEVKLGLMPGACGTQNLPRLVGIERALDMAALGEPVDAATALAIGLVDELAPDGLRDAAFALARRIADQPVRRTRDRIVEPVADAVIDSFLAQHARKFRGLDAPRLIVDSVRASACEPFDLAAGRERERFLALRDGPQAQAMRHAFHAEREAAKVPGLDGAEPRTISQCGVIGAGTMGTGIAIALLSAGLPVTICEQNPEALQRGMERIEQTIRGNVRAGRSTEAQAQAALASLRPVLDIAELAGADLIIEAAFETMDVKQAIFSRLDQVAKPGAILASNTSYLDIDAIAAHTGRPGDVVGLHFFSPANVMKLLEIVRGRDTAPDVIATALAFARRIGKIAVVAGNCHGFIGNRMLAVRRREAEAMIMGGASPAQVDRVLEAFGFPMGPFRMADLAGLDLGWSRETSTGATIRERLCEAGRLGQKSGAGFYDYDRDRKAVPSPQAEAIIAGFSRDHGIVRRDYDDAEILDRLLWPMIDEGARLLGEGIAQRASDIDVVWLNGYGWPRWTGGPMHHASQTGIAEVCQRLVRLGHEPSDALRRLALPLDG
jgi:3-hydroxyacyl-CoA dehydrogenase